MQILSHRGLWLTPEEKNSAGAFLRSFEAGFGTETDIRDRNGELVISHDLATDEAMTLHHFLTLLGTDSLPLALNIKADGLADQLHRTMARHPHINWFVFDMSIPDMRGHLRVGNPTYARMSEVEQHPAWLDRITGIWLDAFDGTWYGEGTIKQLLNAGKKVCVVSPELHKRPCAETWQMLRPLAHEAGLSICTDTPHEARLFFSESTR